MSVETYLGNPPPHIVQWIIDHSGPAGHPETRVKYTGDTEWTPVSIEGEIALVDDMDETGQIENPYNIVAIEIGTDVTSIGRYAFYNCTNLTSVTIPDSVTSIGDYAFYNCSGLTSVTIGNYVTSIGWTTFQGCTSLTSITIPNNVTSIGQDAFSNCISLTSMTFLGKTMEQIPNIEDGEGNKQYPWGISDTSIIHVA